MAASRRKLKEGEELHQIIISDEEVKNRPKNQTESGYMIERVCKKTNRLGGEHKKVIAIEWEKDSYGNWTCRYYLRA